MIFALEAGIGLCASLYFIYAALHIIENYENQIRIVRTGQVLSLSGMVIMAGCLLLSVSEQSFFPNLCSMGILAVLAVVDAQTGYVYDCFGYFAVICTGILSMQKGMASLSNRELGMILLFLAAVIIAAALKGLGKGDVPIYFALLFYYIKYTAFPADAVLFMLLASQMFFGFAALIKRRKRLPLVPYIFLSHLMTLCIWGI